MFSVEENWEAYVKFTLEHIDPERLDDLKRIYFSGTACLLNMMNRMEERDMDAEAVSSVLSGVEEEVIMYEQKCNTGIDMKIENPTGVKH